MSTMESVNQLNTYRSYVSLLADANAKDENKLKAAQELSDNFEAISSSPLATTSTPQHPSFLDHAIKIFIKILQEGQPQFISEHSMQQLRKLILEMIHRIPPNEHLRPYVKTLLSLMFRLLEIENEENVLVALRVIIELHKQFRPQYNPEIQHFLTFVKNVYKELPNHLNKLFGPKVPLSVTDLSDINLDLLLCEVFTSTPIHTQKTTMDGQNMTFTVIPKGVLSLRVLAELPIIVVLMYQLYKMSVHNDVAEFIPLIMNTITLQPTSQHRSSDTFNKELLVEFMAAQIKTLSFLAYIVRNFEEIVSSQAPALVKGMISLFTLCPHEVSHLRKELLIAARHILQLANLRVKFVTVLDRLFDEDQLVGTGWTSQESLRPLYYSTLADYVHHIRTRLGFSDLAKAIDLFSRNVHDDHLLPSIQTMCCKLLLNLVECIREKSDGSPQGRDLVFRLLQVFVMKFKSIAQIYLPNIIEKCKAVESSQASASNTSTTAITTSSRQTGNDASNQSSNSVEDIKPPNLNEDAKTRLPTVPQAGLLSVQDCRALVKTLVCGVKTITWGCSNCKPFPEATPAQAKQFSAKETEVFIKLVKWGLQALDVYTLTIGPAASTAAGGTQAGTATQRPTGPQNVRTKEEKEVLEHFAGVFSMMNNNTFREIFSSQISYVVARIYKNTALQLVANSLLANIATSSVFANILVEFLLKHMEDMGSHMELSNLYLRLFKMVFGSVTLFANENEQMLKPHLHQIVNRSMELALSAKEPYNYFLLLRALFRSIGGGSHDLLYQEFLPLLPNLLQGLNSLQSGLHKQHMKDLFVELCLTVPVRLSSLLPYLPMLMDPLVSALNGSQTLVSQGLRTLELCVDNLQPDFLYEHIQPVRAELMQALWRTLRNPNDQIAQVAFRVLGKFGGGNRKMLVEPQRLQYNGKDSPGPCIDISFPEYSNPIHLPVEKAIETAFTALKSSSTEPFYRRQCWELIQCYLFASIQLDENRSIMKKLLTHPSFVENPIFHANGEYYRCPDTLARKVQQTALTAMFVAAAIKELRKSVLTTMISIVQHYTTVAIVQQSGAFAKYCKPDKMTGMDPLVLIDALAAIMGHEEKELCKPGSVALALIFNTAIKILGSKERACELPLLEYLGEQLCGLCYERAWYAKIGGCIAIQFLSEKSALKWVYQHMYQFLKALIFVMMDLTGEVSSGAVDMAKSNLEKILRMCAKLLPPDAAPDLVQARTRGLNDVSYELVKQVTSPNATVREQAMKSLEVIAEETGQTVTSVMEPHRDALKDMIPPKKHLLRYNPINTQIAIMEGNTFCTTLEPRLFSIDLEILEHKVFFMELLNMCDAEDSQMAKYPCYKNVANLIPVRCAALRILAASHYITMGRERTFSVLYKATTSLNPELQQTGFKCMKKYIAGAAPDKETVAAAMRPLLLQLGDYRSLTLHVVQRLSWLTQLFPKTFSEKLCDQLLAHITRWMHVAVNTQATASSNEVKICAAILGLFGEIPAASAKFVERLITIVIKTEKDLNMEAASPFREPLRKFLKNYPKETVVYLLIDENVKKQQMSRFLIHLVKQPGDEGETFRKVLESQPQRLIDLAIGNMVTSLGVMQTVQHVATAADKAEMRWVSIRITSILSRNNPQWLTYQKQLIETYRNIWMSKEYHDGVKDSMSTVDYCYWTEPKLLVRVLLRSFQQQPMEIDLLFQLLRALSARYLPDFTFLKVFLSQTIAQTYDIPWKQCAFKKFVSYFKNPENPNELKAKILQYIIIPCFTASFEKGEGDLLIEVTSSLEHDNLVAIFINQVIDSNMKLGDSVRILLLQLSCLLVEHAASHIHDSGNKRQGNKLRTLMTFAWPCLLTKSCVDPTTKYHGHLLLSHIIARFAIHKKIVLQVFHSLLKAHAQDARLVVRQALEILTPAMPVRMEDGNTMLTHWTRKIIVEEGHTVAQLVHILQLLVRHHKVFYPIRHALLPHMVTSITRLGFPVTTNIEQRKLTLDLCEVILKWEAQRNKDLELEGEGVKREPDTESRKLDPNRPIEKVHIDAVVNFLLRFACQIQEGTGSAGGVGEALSVRAVKFLKAALKPDMWPQAELKLSWFDKILSLPEPQGSNVCTALELLTYLLGTLRKEVILTSFKPLQRGIASCMSSSNTKVIRAVHSLMSKLMSIFPPEPSSSSVASKHDELETLYANVGKVVYEGLNNYEKNASAPASSLFSTLMILKAACSNNPCFIDRLITTFMKVLQRLTKEHLSATGSSSENAPVSSELLILSLDLVKNRITIMGPEMRKSFIGGTGSILISLIEKSPDVKVLKAITKIVEEWVTLKSTTQGPSLREKSCLLVRMMQFYEKRFPEEQELHALFLELVLYCYKDEALKGSELTSKLELAFMAGLRCNQPPLREKFFQVLNLSMRKRLHDRLLYIICSQNWETMGPHFWIRQCLELLLVTASPETDICIGVSGTRLPAVSMMVNLADSSEKESFQIFSSIKDEPSDVDGLLPSENQDDLDIEERRDGHETEVGGAQGTLQDLLQRQMKFLDTVKETKTVHFLNALCQLAHMDIGLADNLWVNLFPRIWSILNERQQSQLGGELVPFICSGSHVNQKECHPSALATFLEGLMRCQPAVPIYPFVMMYLGKSHNMWHRMALALEQLAYDPGSLNQLKTRREAADCYEFEPPPTPLSHPLDALASMYDLLGEEDLWAGLWTKKAIYPETVTGIAFETQGLFERAQEAYEEAQHKVRNEVDASGRVPPEMNFELTTLEDRWIRCGMELNQWDGLLEYGSSHNCHKPELVLESAWRVPNWTLMKDVLQTVENQCQRTIAWKVNLYRGYLAICHPDDNHLNLVERLVEVSSNLCIKEWRRLPHIVSQIHIPYLQAAQQVMELHEASQIHQGLNQFNRSTSGSTINNQVHDMKAIMKTWRNRLPVMWDDLRHWSDIFTWRQHHYQFIISHYEQQDLSGTQSMIGVHASAQAIIHFGKIARKHGLASVCLNSLSRIHTIPSVPIIDCFEKIKQQVKCYLHMTHQQGQDDLQEGLEVIESTNLKFFLKDMTAEFFAMKGHFLAQIGRSEEANRSLSVSVQLHDQLGKGWAMWGDYLEQVFMQDKSSPKSLRNAMLALICYLHAVRQGTEPKNRKYLAKVLWLLSYDDDKSTLADTVKTYSVGVPPPQWVPWVGQLLVCLVRKDGTNFSELLQSLGRMYPQALYFPIRALYLTLKVEQRERFKCGELQGAANQTSSPQSSGSSTPEANRSEATAAGAVPNIRATDTMRLCSQIMHMLRDQHPTVLSSLEGIADGTNLFRECWYEEIMRHMRQVLMKCYVLAFENRSAVMEATVSHHTLNYVRKLTTSFGIGVENAGAEGQGATRRTFNVAQDSVFQRMKTEFAADFDFTQPGTTRLHNLIQKLNRWIKALETKTKTFPKVFLMEDRCKFLSSFCQQTAEIELPGEFLLPKPSHYYVRVSRFLPRVEIVEKHNTSARRLYIRGHNGKVYPYLILCDSTLMDARREERLLQLLRFLNHLLTKQKESARRQLCLVIPRVVAVSPQMRLVEDTPSSVSLLEIWKSKSGSVETFAPLNRYYERMRIIQARGSQPHHQVLRDVLKDVQNTLLPKTMLKEWALHTYPQATDYWTFRKQLTMQLSLWGFAEYVLHLTRLNPEMMYIHQDSGLINVAYYKFDFDDTGGELESNRPVPFRLTPNLVEVIRWVGVGGPVGSCMIAAARALSYPPFQVQALLRAILRDEVIHWQKRVIMPKTVGSSDNDVESDVLVALVSKAVNAIMNRLCSLAHFDGQDNKVSALVTAALNADNLCRMDPAWHPWL